MPFCSNCGAKLYDGASFCSECGVPVSTVQQQNNNTTDSRQQAQKFQSAVDRAADSVLAGIKKVADGTKQIFEAENTKKAPDTPGNKTQQEQTPPQVPHSDYTQRQQEYSGKLIKCPNCGEVLSSFTVNCPVCGYELRGLDSTYSIKSLQSKIEQLEAQSTNQKGPSLIKQMFGYNKLEKVDSQIVSLIKNYTIPNTKEDILEFLILASSNIDFKVYGLEKQQYQMNNPAQLEISDAWIAKFEQAYQKAKILFGESEEFKNIDDLYKKTMKKLKFAKSKGLILLLSLFGLVFLIIIFCFIMAKISG